MFRHLKLKIFRSTVQEKEQQKRYFRQKVLKGKEIDEKMEMIFLCLLYVMVLMFVIYHNFWVLQPIVGLIPSSGIQIISFMYDSADIIAPVFIIIWYILQAGRGGNMNMKIEKNRHLMFKPITMGMRSSKNTQSGNRYAQYL